MKHLLSLLVILASASFHPLMADEKPESVPSEKEAFSHADAAEWETVFEDPGTGNWKKHWFLDGEIGAVENTPDGMVLASGPRFGEDAHHMVLWTRSSFSGDIKIEYEYTRLDFAQRAVNILFVQATGSGIGPYAKDIEKWKQLRETPSMSLYFLHMNLYHISYAAFGNNWQEDKTDYVRARRYDPEMKGLAGTELTPDYLDTGLFAPGEPQKITVIKRDQTLYMKVEAADQTAYFRWINDRFPPIYEGRVGFRQMYTRAALYRDIRISQLD